MRKSTCYRQGCTPMQVGVPMSISTAPMAIALWSSRSRARLPRWGTMLRWWLLPSTPTAAIEPSMCSGTIWWATPSGSMGTLPKQSTRLHCWREPMAARWPPALPPCLLSMSQTTSASFVRLPSLSSILEWESVSFPARRIAVWFWTWRPISVATTLPAIQECTSTTRLTYARSRWVPHHDAPWVGLFGMEWLSPVRVVQQLNPFLTSSSNPAVPAPSTRSSILSQAPATPRAATTLLLSVQMDQPTTSPQRSANPSLATRQYRQSLCL